MSYAGVSHQSFQVPLGQCHQVAHQHGQGRQHYDDDLPLVPPISGRHEGLRQQPQHQGKGRRLGRDSQVGRYRQGRAFVGIGRPHVEGHRRQLEAQACHNQRKPGPQRGADVAGLTQFLGNGIEPGNAQRAVNHAQAVEQDSRRQGSNDDVLQAAFVGLGIPQRVGHHHVQAEAQQFQRNVSCQQLPGHGHQVHAQNGEEQETVKFAGMVQEFLDVVNRTENDEDANPAEEDLEEQGVRIHRQQAVVQRLVLPGQHQHRQDGQTDQPQGRQPAQQVLMLIIQEKVQDEHQEREARQDKLRRQQMQVGGQVLSSQNSPFNV